MLGWLVWFLGLARRLRLVWGVLGILGGVVNLGGVVDLWVWLCGFFSMF